MYYNIYIYVDIEIVVNPIINHPQNYHNGFYKPSPNGRFIIGLPGDVSSPAYRWPLLFWRLSAMLKPPKSHVAFPKFVG
jgi:hypothetical protein